ncbi:MAG: DUF2794 domain-containing protein [Brucellaceae bacterium]|nr:DUF2794 domain-containing protein [Brucellaceae bacterium]
MEDGPGSIAGDSDHAVLVPFPGHRHERHVPVMFQRRELDLILNIYSMMVGAGEWRDYAIDSLRDRAVFSVFRRSSEVPLFTIEKNPKLARKQGAYSVINTGGMVLKRGHDLANVLQVFDKMLRRAGT